AGFTLEDALKTVECSTHQTHGIACAQARLAVESVKSRAAVRTCAQIANHPIRDDCELRAEAHDVRDADRRVHRTQSLAPLVDSQKKVPREQRNDLLTPLGVTPNRLAELGKVRLEVLALQVQPRHSLRPSLSTNQIPAQHVPIPCEALQARAAAE